MEKNIKQSVGDLFTTKFRNAEKVLDSAPIINYYSSTMHGKSNDKGGMDFAVTINDNGEKVTKKYSTDANSMTFNGNTSGNYWNEPYIGDPITAPWQAPYRPYDSTPWVPAIWRDDWFNYKHWGKSELEDFVDGIKKLAGEVPNKLPTQLVSSSYPPSNIFIDTDKNLHIQVAAAGFAKDEITVSTENDYLIVSFKKQELPFKDDKELENVPKEERPITISYLQKGIKMDNAELKFYIDSKRFNGDTATVKLENGLLEITILKDEKVDVKKTLMIEQK
jgi:HSP20 family molecular chaperone IbpA